MNRDQYSKLLRSTDEWNGWRNTGRAHPSKDGVKATRVNDSDVDLSYADLSNKDLKNADLSGANLSFANICGANLSECVVEGAELQFILYNDLTVWPAGVEIPSNARRGPSDGIESATKGLNSQREDYENATAFIHEIAVLFASLDVVRRSLPEVPNHPDQQALIGIIDSLIDQVHRLNAEVEDAKKTVAALRKELESVKSETRSALSDFLQKSRDSVAGQVGPTIKWLITTGGVTAIAAEALKEILS